ncbi:MAG: multisubunit Na+/H+ antiporter MnhG subunit [Glaciecola sp.]|jgi:multisubunit Na+/H+ antiporter MnhG subunit
MKKYIALTKEKTGRVLLILLGVIALVAYLLSPSLNQDTNYHLFSDQTQCAAVPNFWNVITNVPFLMVGVLGLIKSKYFTKLKLQKQVFFAGISLVAFGSGYYHWNPNNSTLVWDRLPMTVAFMALFSVIIGEYFNEKLGRKTFVPLLITGIASVFYWVLFDDLKFYVLVQFYPMLAIPIILIFMKRKNQLSWGYWALLVAYVLAKIFEHFDHETHDFLSFISGHSIKHLVAALGVYCLLYFYQFKATRK